MTTTAIIEKTLPSTLTASGQEIDSENTIDGPELTPKDRCDTSDCKAAALVRAVHDSGELLFCGNHGRKNLSALLEAGWLIDDQTFRAFEKASSPLTEEDA